MSDKEKTDNEIAREVQARQCACHRLSWPTKGELRVHLTYELKRITEQLAQLGKS